MKLLGGAALALVGAGVVCPACGAGPGDASARTSPGNGQAIQGRPGAALEAATFRVDGMTCGGCALATEIAVRRVRGVVSVKAFYDEASRQGRASVQFDPSRTTTEAIAAAIRSAGFRPSMESGPGAG